MQFFDLIKAIIFGIVEGITEWLPVSSTGHLILLEELLPLNVSEEFFKLFLVVIQLGAILAVIILFWKKIWPFYRDEDGRLATSRRTLKLWGNILISCIPAAVIGILLDDIIDQYLYNYLTVALALIVVGILFILVENRMEGRRFAVNKVSEITPRLALFIGLFQLIAAIFPGTSRSGVTILGALLLGISRTAAAEYTFLLAIPVMAGASFLKLVKYIVGDGPAVQAGEIVTLIVGSLVAFIVSLLCIRFFMRFVRRNDFKIFGYYRIALGILVLLFFLLRG